MLCRFCLFLLVLPGLLLGEPDFLKAVPLWNASQVRVDKVEGGASKPNYRVTDGERAYFVSVAVEHLAELGVNRQREAECLRVAAEAGLAPAVCFISDDASVIVTEFLTAEPLQGRDKRLHALLRELHHSSLSFPSKHCAFSAARTQFAKLKDKGAYPWDELMARLDRIQKDLEPYPLCPCHGDLHNGNVLDDGKRLWLVDWEYAAMGDPQLDIASYCANHFMSPQEAQDFYLNYAPEASEAELRRFRQLQFVAILRWAIWCMHMDEVSPVDWPYATWTADYMQLIQHYT